MGIIKAPDVKNYWAKCFPFRGLWARKLFPNRDRFRAILAALQVHYYEVAYKQDPLNKVRPFYSHMREVCSSLFVPSQNIAVDERMVKSKARFFFKQYIRNKPTKWGFKLWVIADFCIHTRHGCIYWQWKGWKCSER